MVEVLVGSRKAVRRVIIDGRGFTLVELLIVIAIIGILAAVAVPSFSKITESAKKKACEANIKTLEGVAVLYRLDTGSYPEDVHTLVSNGYLDGEVTCPVHGDEYEIDDEGNVTCPYCSEH